MIFLLLSIFVIIAMIAIFPPNTKLVYNLFFILCGILLMVIAAFRGDGDSDYSGYIEMFNRQDFFVVEPTFTLISYIVRTFLGGNVIYLFIIYAILGVTIKLFAIKQLSELWFLSVVIYVSNFFILHEMTQIRAGVASAFLLLCVKPIYERNGKMFLLFTTIACLFHYSAIIILPLWFLTTNPKKTWLLLSVPISYSFFFLNI
jgi:hypothetical protein